MTTARIPLARRIGAGKMLFVLYHGPMGAIRRSIAEGGPAEQWKTERGRLAMIQAASHLPPLQDLGCDGKAPEVHFLTGEKYWYQTLFCIYSLLQTSGRRIAPVLYDDGSLDDALRTVISSIIPWTRYRLLPELEGGLDDYLPWNRYPTLRMRREEYPHLRKLVDVHAGRAGWTLVADSDMLFFRRPDALLGWMDNPQMPLTMVDVTRSYGYSDRLMAELAGAPVPDRVNVGLVGLKSESIDWDRLEWTCRRMLDQEGSHYLQEQALTAILLAQAPHQNLPETDYIVMPGAPEWSALRGTLHHYVANSKRFYFRAAWRLVLDPSSRKSTPSAREAL